MVKQMGKLGQKGLMRHGIGALLRRIRGSDMLDHISLGISQSRPAPAASTTRP